MDYRGASKDETYGSKNRNQSHWLKAAWPEKRESIWPAVGALSYLDRPWVPVCLYLLLILASLFPSFLSLFSSFSSLFLLFFTFLYLLLSAPPPLADLFISKEARRAYALAAAAAFILGPCTKPIRGGESFHANSPENAFFVVRRVNALVPNSFPRQNRDASSDRSKATHPRVSSLLWSLDLAKGRREERPVRFFPRNYTRSYPRCGELRVTTTASLRWGGPRLVLVLSIVRGSVRGLIKDEIKTRPLVYCICTVSIYLSKAEMEINLKIE